MLEYAERVLGPIKVDDVRGTVTGTIFPVFRGRYGPFAVVLEEVILSKKDTGIASLTAAELNAVFLTVKQGMTRSEGLEGVQINFYSNARRIVIGERGPDLPDVLQLSTFSIVDTLLDPVVLYYYGGICPSFPFPCNAIEEEQVPLTKPQRARFFLEHGLARVDVERDLVVIDEPLPLEGLYNFFRDVRTIIRPPDRLERQKLGTGYGSSTEGLLWQQRKCGTVLPRMSLFSRLHNYGGGCTG